MAITFFYLVTYLPFKDDGAGSFDVFSLAFPHTETFFENLEKKVI